MCLIVGYKCGLFSRSIDGGPCGRCLPFGWRVSSLTLVVRLIVVFDGAVASV